jgi:hypothetical protein
MKAVLLLSFLFALSANSSAQKLEPALIQTMGGEKIGYKNPAGQVVIKPRFEEANVFLNGYATVSIGGRWGIIDSTGREVLPLKYRELDYFAEGLAGASLDGKKFGFVNTAGAVVIPFTFDGVGSFSEGRATAILGRKCALINKKGTLLTPYKYQGIEEMQGGIARVLLKNDSPDGVEHSHYWGFIDANGREISKLNCYGHDSKNIGNGFAIACIELPEAQRTQYTHYASALLDKTGRVVIPFSAGYNFDSWTAKYLQVQKGFPRGVVDYTGKVVLAPNFWQITDFVYGEDGKSLAKAFTSERDFFYLNREYRCVEYDRVKCPEY